MNSNSGLNDDNEIEKRETGVFGDASGKKKRLTIQQEPSTTSMLDDEDGDFKL